MKLLLMEQVPAELALLPLAVLFLGPELFGPLLLHPLLTLPPPLALPGAIVIAVGIVVVAVVVMGASALNPAPAKQPSTRGAAPPKWVVHPGLVVEQQPGHAAQVPPGCSCRRGAAVVEVREWVGVGVRGWLVAAGGAIGAW